LKLGKLLEQTVPFAELDDEQIEKVAALAHQHRYEEGEFVVLNGEPWPFLALVKEGSFHALKESAEGRTLVVLTIGPADVFWGLTFFDEHSIMPVSLECAKSGALITWSRDDLRPFLIANGSLLWSLCGLLIQRMERASNIVESLAFQPVAGRIANLLLERYGNTGEDPVARDLTLDTMAAYVGTTREMVCRVLYRFSDQNLIHITRTEFSITDQDGLATLAGSNPTR
jgi:CRP/FNR family transcriptional regulator